jgi:hypothetical protein
MSQAGPGLLGSDAPALLQLEDAAVAIGKRGVTL